MTEPPPKKPVQLSEYYYHENFNTLIEFVFDRYEPLLDSHELHFYHTYQTLSQPAQQLYSRILMRRRDFMRVSKTVYPEIINIQAALKELLGTGLCQTAQAEDAQEWLGLFRREEIQAALPSLSKSFSASWLAETSEARDLLLKADLLGFTPASLLLQTDQVCKIVCKDAFAVFQLLFFGDLYQDISAFVLRDLGFNRFEDTIQSDTQLPFTSRPQLLAHLHYYQCIAQFDDDARQNAKTLIELHARLCELPDNIVNDDIALKRRLAKWCNRIARQLERLGATDAAAEIYSTITQPPARERLARIEAKRGNPHTAFDICQSILNKPLDAEELDFAEQFSQPLAKKLELEFRAVKKYAPPVIELTLARSSLCVEFTAALHYAKTGKCFYVENSLISGIFGLAMWDIIFAPIAGAFFHPFQTAPADFRDSEFVARRKPLFDQRLQELQSNGLTPFVLTNLHHKRGINNPLVNWQRLNRQLAVLAIRHIPVDHWLSFFDHLLHDVRSHRSGLPDLIYFPDDGGYQLLEVKGPGDQLQKNQRRWMRQFATHNIPHAIVNISYSDSQYG